jgi:ribosome-associated protein
VLITTLQLVHAAAMRKLAKEPVALDVREISTITDVIHVCHGDSTRAVDAITEEILGALKGAHAGPFHVEGRGALQWVLIDAGDLMIHIFLAERREYYNLERLWHDAPPIPLNDAA